MIPKEFSARVSEETDLVQLIQGYLPALKKVGNTWKAPCPFHEEATPSFTVAPQKGFYHCFGCGAHGDAIKFVMEHTKCKFPDAVQVLADRLGLEVYDNHEKRETSQADKRRYIGIMSSLRLAQEYYEGSLCEDDAALAYLQQRGISDQTAARFGLGFAQDHWRNLSKAFKFYQDEALVNAGLVIKTEDGKRYDRFRGRVMFPIRNRKGDTIGFGGRIVGEGDPKYLNSPETDVFKKGQEMYGLFEHREAINASRQAILVEGYMDVIMLNQFCVKNAVASLGTAVNGGHIAKLFRIADEVVLCMDGDKAGRNAAWRSVEICLDQLVDGKRIAFLFLPEAHDPDSFVRANGGEAFKALLPQATPLSEFLFNEIATRCDITNEEGKVRYITLMQPYLDRIKNAPLMLKALTRKLSEFTSIPL
jgi:DNA primase